jgi:hypothetical protein
VTVQRAAEADIDLPDFQTFWQGGVFRLDPKKVPARTFILERFRADLEGAPLATPSGKAEIFSERIASFDLADCKGHPMWFDKEEFIGSARSARFPLALNSNQSVTRLHSQYDFGKTSRNAKIDGREARRATTASPSATSRPTSASRAPTFTTTSRPSPRRRGAHRGRPGRQALFQRWHGCRRD